MSRRGVKNCRQTLCSWNDTIYLNAVLWACNSRSNFVFYKKCLNGISTTIEPAANFSLISEALLYVTSVLFKNAVSNSRLPIVGLHIAWNALMINRNGLKKIESSGLDLVRGRLLPSRHFPGVTKESCRNHMAGGVAVDIRTCLLANVGFKRSCLSISALNFGIH